MDKSATITPNNDVIMVKSFQNENVNDDDTKLDRTLQVLIRLKNVNTNNLHR